MQTSSLFLAPGPESSLSRYGNDRERYREWKERERERIFPGFLPFSVGDIFVNHGRGGGGGGGGGGSFSGHRIDRVMGKEREDVKGLLRWGERKGRVGRGKMRSRYIDKRGERKRRRRI